MTDYLLNLSRNPAAKKVIRQLKLPIPLPQPLKRATKPWEDNPLTGMAVLIGGEGRTVDTIHAIITDAGATALRPGGEGAKLNALVFDATGLKKADELTQMYDFLHPNLRKLSSCGRVILIGSDPQSLTDSETAATAESLKGLAKSLGKEVGRKGSTAQVIYVDSKSEDQRHLAAPLRFILSPRSAFISGQVFSVSDLVKLPEDTPWVAPLSGKTALVTGAAQGIGAAIARKLGSEGAKVIALDRPGEGQKLQKTVEGIEGSTMEVDLAEADAAQKIAEKVKFDFGGLDILVNNAGITRDKTLARMKKDWWEQTIDVNLGVVTSLTKNLAEGVMRDHGRIVCMSSISGIGGNAGQTNYATAKAGLIGFVKSSAKDLATKGISINAVAPGFIETRMTQAIPLATREVARRFNALSQAGQPEDVGELVTFLSSPGAAGITGTCIRVCGLNMLGA